MPALKERLRSQTPEGYAEQATVPKTPPAPPEQKSLGADPMIRCPLPPFNAGPDTLRQFDQNGKIPARRVIPLPAMTGINGAINITNNTSVISQGGGGSGNVPVTVAAKTMTITVPILLPGDAATLTVTVTAVAVLMILGSSAPCEVRIYGDANTQASDLPRLTDTAPPFEVTQGLTTDVVLDTSPLRYNWQNRLFVNQDAPITKNMYVTVINPTMGAVTPSITITYLPLE